VRRTRVLERDGVALLLHTAGFPEGEEDQGPPPEVFADFEGADYGEWEVEGEAFGSGPARGTFPGQQNVFGYTGEGLVNTYLDGDDAATGTLTSPLFTIRREYINFLIGGGAHQGETCVNLVVDGEVVRTSSGRNTEVLAWDSWYVGDLRNRDARIQVVDQSSTGWGHINLDRIEFWDRARVGNLPSALERAPDYGTMALACRAPASPAGRVGTGPDAASGEASFADRLVGELRTRTVDLDPGEEITFTFALAWNFPNAEQGQFYATRFGDAEAVLDYLLREEERLTRETRAWRDLYYDSTLPYWLLDRLHSTVSYLATGTCRWWANGRFWAFEGVSCCAGTCTHVWNYAHTHARLFPGLARVIREMQDFSPRADGGGFHPDTGLVGFRSDDNYAADGQCGTILKAYREHLMSADTRFLERFWPRIRKALEFSIAQDSNADGLIENLQHNTYDINYFGANTFVGSLYLAALRAGEEMAREMGDEPFARHCRAIYDRGRRLTLERLWDGEYFFQDVDLEKHPLSQYGRGCLSDQMFGQGWAHQVGLGYLYPQEHVRSALKSVWTYNWAPDITPYNDTHRPFRWFISPGQAGLLTCTWPKSAYLPDGTSYKNEVWTGIEYQVAGHMIWEGMVQEGLAMVRAIHDRYQPELLNPYNEVECGDHYARAMASWGVYLALAGFSYHGPRGHIGFAPRLSPEAFRAAFTTAEGWIAYEQTRDRDVQKSRVQVAKGRLQLTRLSLGLPGDTPIPTVTLTRNGARLSTGVRLEQGTLILDLEAPLVLQENDILEARIRLGAH
jgi:hypothetical protein